jgi:hypothetical protein
MSSAKEDLALLIQQQPEDRSELAFHVMVQRGLIDSDARRNLSNEDMQRRIRLWRK